MRNLLLGLLSGAAAVAALALLPGRGEGQVAELESSRGPAPVPGPRGSGTLAAPPLRQSPEKTPLRVDPERLNQTLREAERAHLKRVGIWGLTNAAAGAALALSTSRDEDPGSWSFGVQTAGWGIINTGIAAAGLAFSGRGDPPETAGDALAAESRWGQILVLNQGLNAGYMMVGGALVVASGRGLERGDEVRGHAWAVVLQGLGLFVLDGVAWLGHRERMGEFGELLDQADMAVAPLPGGRVLWGMRIPFRGRGGDRGER